MSRIPGSGQVHPSYGWTVAGVSATVSSLAWSSYQLAFAAAALAIAASAVAARVRRRDESADALANDR